MTISPLAIVAAAIASWIFGALWFGLFGRPWAVGLGLMPADAPQTRGKPPVFALVFSLVAEIAMAAMLEALLSFVAGPRFGMKLALVGAFLVWLGFIAPTIATNYAYQKRPLAVYAVDLGHWLGVVFLQAAILSLLA